MDRQRSLGNGGRCSEYGGADHERACIFRAGSCQERGQMGVAKAKAQWTHAWGGRVETTIWGAGAWTFDRSSDARAIVGGIGLIVPRTESTRWIEYGGRVGCRLSDRFKIDLFANGLKASTATNQAQYGVGVKYVL